MDIPDIKIPDIRIEAIPPARTLVIPPRQALGFPAPSILLPGCYKQHRDARATNTQIIEDDPTGSYWVCSNGPLPTIKAPEYNPSRMVYSNDKKEEKSNNKPTEFKVTDSQIPKKKKEKDEVFVPCRGPKDQKKGDYRNDKRLERVVDWKLSDDGKDCITLYESVTFIDSVLPSTSAALNVATISLIAASAPLLLNLIKGASKSLFKKVLTRKKK